MKMMGLTDFPYWLAWFIYYTIIITILAILMTILMIPMFPNSQKIFVLLYFWLYGMALFSYSIFISSFFSNGKVASIAGSLILFFSSFLILIVQGENGNKGAKHVFSIFPVVAVQLVSPIMFAFEGGGTGIRGNNVGVEYYNFKIAYCYMWLIISFFVFLILGIYLENVLPQAQGVRKPVWYLFKPSYWFPSLFLNKNDDHHHSSNDDKLDDDKF